MIAALAGMMARGGMASSASAGAIAGEASAMASASSSIVGSFSQARNAMNSFGSSIGGLSKWAVVGAQQMSTFTSALIGLLKGPADIAANLGGQISSMTNLINPGAVLLFNRELNNVYATIGQMLTPVLKGLTTFLGKWGDQLAQLGPVLEPLFNAIGNFFGQIVDAFAPVIKALSPIIGMAVQFFTAYIGVVGQVITAMAKLYSWFLQVYTAVIKFLSFGAFSGGPGMDPNKKRTQAITETHVSSAEEAMRNAFASSAKLIRPEGEEEKKDPFVSALEALWTKIDELILKIQEWIDALPNMPHAGGTIEAASDFMAGINPLFEIALDIKRMAVR